MVMSTQDLLRLTVAALMAQTGERQSDLAAGIGQTQGQVSRKQKGQRSWSLDDVDLLAAHYGMLPLDLLAGPTHAAERLAPALHSRGGRQTPPAPVPTVGSPAPVTPPPAVPAAPPAERVPAPLAPAQPEPSPEQPPAPAPAPAPAPRRRTSPSAPLADEIRATVTRTLTEHQGDLETAKAALTRSAIPDVMALFKFSRVGGRYEHTEFPPTADLLKKKSQKGADEVWEGRPKWRASELHRAAGAGLMRLDVTALDMNAAYLAALKTHLPIGRLVPSPGDEAALDPRRSGIHRITPPQWTTSDLPNPLGARKVPGDLWIAEPTLRLLLDCAKNGLCKAPTIHESLTSGSTEGLLEKMRRALVEVRKEAIAKDDELTTEYVKFMYSKFVSTIGESSANREIRRPDWMHIIRAQAFANLWRKAQKAHASGLTVIEMSGTDELHVAGDWRQVFGEGRDLSQVKQKRTYTLGGDQ
ncbi:helix-turn-helix domain-containing protein [Streptomyces fuscigenes]|uniref:helix-turn-helix domain-containing protein n=1 Tax=Streptomyces fuscigenes TaxID=1528880 RepID=UPI001F2CDD70|nr:helix-turn-helix transcriptional regulator [Streptomyces fuscigenes]MCF3960440.1 helix-turn-helix transcriptional regulator [Streptomyces fuscigenes]